MTIIDTLRSRITNHVVQNGCEPEEIEVTEQELRSYIGLWESIKPELHKSDEGYLIPMFGDLPLHCTYRGIPLRCKDAG